MTTYLTVQPNADVALDLCADGNDVEVTTREVNAYGVLVRVPFAVLRAALDSLEAEEESDGSDALTAEEGDPRETVEFWKGAADVAKRRAEKAERDRDGWERRAGTSAATSSRLLRERDEARREREDLRASLKEANAALRASREQPVNPTGEMVGRLFRAAGEVVPGWGVSMNDCHHLLQVALTEPTRPEGAEELARLIATADVGEWDCGDLADALLATGRVRVVTKEQS